MISWPYTFDPAIDGRIAAGSVALDAPAPYVGAVSRLWVATLTADGLDASRPIRAYPPGTGIVLQDRGNAAIYVSLVMTAPAVAYKGYLEIPVICPDASATPLAAGAAELFLLPVVAALAAVATATDPLLVTLETAKEHLRERDPSHDPDVTQKLTAASGAIRDYLKDRNDPTWTPDTVPPWVAAAVLLLLAHLYEHRGDEFGKDSDNDDRVWTAIGNLCRRSRDPALA